MITPIETPQTIELKKLKLPKDAGHAVYISDKKLIFFAYDKTEEDAFTKFANNMKEESDGSSDCNV